MFGGGAFFFQPTFTFMKGGKAVRELKGADAAGLKQAIQDLS